MSACVQVQFFVILISVFVFNRQAKRLLSQIVERCRNGNETSQDVLIPASKVGLVIGKGGDTIKQLQVCLIYSVIKKKKKEKGTQTRSLDASCFVK